MKFNEISAKLVKFIAFLLDFKVFCWKNSKLWFLWKMWYIQASVSIKWFFFSFFFLQRLAHSWIKRRNKKWARNFFEVGSGSAFVPSKNIYKNNPQMIFLNALGIFLLSSQAASTNDGSEIDISRNEILFFYRRLFLYIQCFSDDYLNFVRNIEYKRNERETYNERKHYSSGFFRS